MKNRIKITPWILMLGLTCLFMSFAFGKDITTSALNKGEIIIVLESYRHNNVVPKRLRRTTDLSSIVDRKELNLEGLGALNISGSQQFTPNNIDLLLGSINTELPLTVVDLREESHGFVNECAFSYSNDNNDANRGLTKQEVLLDEKTKLSEIEMGSKMTFFNKPHITLEVNKIQDEKELTKSRDLGYIRVTVTDKTMPKDNMVEYFVETVNSLSEDTWLHFHCKHGVGRTSTFMIMYDMMKNHKTVEAKDIINRQLALAGFKETTIDNYLSENTLKFLNNFYEYVKENSDDYKVKWSEYNKKS